MRSPEEKKEKKENLAPTLGDGKGFFQGSRLPAERRCFNAFQQLFFSCIVGLIDRRQAAAAMSKSAVVGGAH